MQPILDHIAWVGTFTGLSLNLSKTIAFYHKFDVLTEMAGITVGNKPVKYLGVHLGQGDLSVLNFEKPLRVARNKLKCWQGRSLTCRPEF